MEKSEYPKRDQSSVLCTTSPLTVLAKSSSPIGVLLSRSEVAKISSQPPLIAYKLDTNIRDMLVLSNQPQEHGQGPLHAIKQNVEHVLSSAPTPTLLALSPVSYTHLTLPTNIAV